MNTLNVLQREILGNNLLVTVMSSAIKFNSFNKFYARATQDISIQLNDAHNVHFNDALLLFLFRNKFHTLDNTVNSIYIINQLKHTFHYFYLFRFVSFRFFFFSFILAKNLLRIVVAKNIKKKNNGNC